MTSLHTKYRPATFDEVLGQDATVKSLKKVIKDKRARTFLFVGPSGTGKTTLARIVAHEVIGPTCTAANLIEYDGASKSGADDIRELITSLNYRAIGGSPVKFVILDEVHKLSSAAWTVLLKPTEEPPSHVYFAFCTTEVGKIPKAILTRVLRYNIKDVAEESLQDLLVTVVDKESLTIDDAIIETIAEAAMGSPRQALVYLEACLGCANLADARMVMRAVGQSKEVVDLARWLVVGKGLNWIEALKYLQPLAGQEAESCRIMLVNYFAAVLLKTKNGDVAKRLLGLMEAFKTPYPQSDKIAPLLFSVGLALNMDQ